MEITGPDRTFAAAAGTPYAAEAAAESYRAGGNAADAAVAAAAAVSVTEPLMSSIGGGGFALVRDPAGGAELIDYYDAMPGKGLPDKAFGAGGSPQTIILKYGAGVRSIVGGASSAVPGSLRGWEKLLARHGKLSLRETLAPAGRFAREGFRLCKTSALWFGVAEEVLRLTDETRKHFYKGERVYLEGEEVRFPELADTLEAVGEGGVGIFYEGELARRISAYMLEMGGIITEEDLAEYEAAVREPMRVMSGAMKLALRDRETAYLDGAENSRVAERLTGEEYAAEQRRRIFSAFGSPHTTHLSCIDSEGLAVSITASMGYGSGLVVPGTGIPMNNTLGEPELNPRGFHALQPGERLISNMSPTIVSSEEGGIIALGSPGASRIPTAILQTVINVLDFGMALEDAVLAPRLHAEGDLFAYEAGARTADLDTYERVLTYETPNMFFGGVKAVRRTPDGRFEAAADPRRSGGTAIV